MNQNKVESVANWLRTLGNRPDALNTSVSPTDVINIREAIADIIYTTKMDQPIICEHMAGIKNRLFMNQMMGYVQYTTINPFAVGQMLECLDLLSAASRKDKNESDDIWKCVHPLIIESSRKLFVDGHYANAACDAFIEINARLKKIYQIIKPDAEEIPDGQDLVNKILSDKATMLEVCDRSTDTGVNIHNGTRFMLSGAMAALRNPKAHANITITADDALRRLMFASILMYKIDEAVKYTGICE